MGSASYDSPSTTTTSSGGSSSTSTNTPFQQEHYQQALGQANNLYQQGLPDYYGGQTVAGMTPAQMESMNMSSNWITGGAQDMMNNQNQQYQQMMSGRVNTGEGSPYGDMADAYTQQATDSANQMMGDVRGNQVMSGQSGGSSRGDMLNNQVVTDTNQQLSNNLAGMYSGAYDQAQNTQNNALGQYGNMMNMPLQMSQAMYNQVGLPQQQQNQAQMDDAKKRYDYESGKEWQNLAQYQNMISGDMGGTQTSSGSNSGSSTTTQAGGPNQLGSDLGALAGMGIGSMFGQQDLGTAAGGFLGGLL